MVTEATTGPRTPIQSWSADHLVLSHFTLARDHDVVDRIEAAAAAGYDGIGLLVDQYQALVAAGERDRLDEALERAAMPLTDIEVLRGWAVGGRDDPDYRAQEDAVWEMADRYGCRYVQAICPTVDDPAAVGPAFAALCDRAADHGLVVGLEFVPYMAVGDLATACRVLDEADRPNGGLCVDTWHLARSGGGAADLVDLGADRVFGIQVNDGPRRPPQPVTDLAGYVDDCLRRRRPPGSGDLDVAGVASTLLAAGVDVPWQLEVCDDRAWGRPAIDHATACAEGMRTLLASIDEGGAPGAV
ncbi:MAG: sugar phosphate isomerase/epimerase [Actinomycetota bacterium]